MATSPPDNSILKKGQRFLSWLREPISFRKTKTPNLPPSDEQIQAKAYELWQQRGHKSSAEENWEDAIRLLKREESLERVVKPIRRLWWRTGVGPDAQRVLKWSGVRDKTGWDFAQLLAAPILLILLGWGLQEYVKERDQTQQRIDEARTQAQQQADKEREQTQQQADKEREEATVLDRARQDTLVKYLDQMAESLNGGLLTAKPGSNQFIVAQARTVIALQSLDRNRQHLVIQFLSAAGLSRVGGEPNIERLSDGSANVTLADGDRVLLLNAQMEKANLAGSDLSGGVFIGANLQDANLGCNPPESRELSQCSDLRWADFRGANLNSANLGSANLYDADLSGANLSGADLSGANLYDADLIGANLYDAGLIGAIFIGANLNSANLSSAQLNSADLRSANLSGANLSSANLSSADLSGANLSSANLIGAIFRGTNLSSASLEGTDLSNADLHDANLSNASLSGADLGSANLSNAILLATDLRTARNFTPEQLAGDEPLLLCKVALPQGITIDTNRDCDRLPQILLKRYPERFRTLDEAKQAVESAQTPQP